MAAVELTKDGNEIWGGQGGGRADPLALSTVAVYCKNSVNGH